MKLIKYVSAFTGVLLLASGASAVQASTIAYEDSHLVSAHSVTSTPFDIVSAGRYMATLVDFEFTSPFDILALNITQGDDVLGFAFDTGKFTFNVLAPGTLVAHLVARPKHGSAGLYALQIKSVPVPSAILLFASGMLGLVTVSRRAGRQVAV